MALKYYAIAEALREEIIRRGPQGDPKLPTEAELMRVYHVSRQTVRQALSVLLAEGLIEKRQGSGTYISPSVFPKAVSSRSIAVLVPDATGNMAPSEFQSVHTIFREAGYSVSVFSTENRTAKEREILLTLLERPVRGLLIQGVRTAFPNPNLPLYRDLLVKGCSVLFLDDAYPDLRNTSVLSEYDSRTNVSERLPNPDTSILQIASDDFGGGELIARHLLSLGHKKIAGIFRLDNISGHRRYAGVLHALCEKGISFDDRSFLWYDSLTTPMPDAKLLLSFIRIQLASCTAVVCQEERIAGWLLHELNKLGVSVPQNISIAAFRDENTDKSDTGRITCAIRPDGITWKSAARLLLSKIEGKNVSSVRLPMVLQNGESTGPAPSPECPGHFRPADHLTQQ
ncbi:MAG: GntR family transcriptional regulator [Lachnospiraceae bacterium]|nr:GntR family transcriptional regulator [Lachnospiraceae bacterium]